MLAVLYYRGDTSDWPRTKGTIVASRTRLAPYPNESKWGPHGLIYAGEYVVSYKVNGIEYQVSTSPLCKDLNQSWLLFRMEQMRKGVEVVVRYNHDNPAEGYPVLFGVSCR